jgi:hypothetical protein
LEALVGESAGASPAVGEPEGVARMLLPDLDVVIDDLFDEHENRTRFIKVVLTDRCVYRPVASNLKSLARCFFFLFPELVRIARFDMSRFQVDLMRSYRLGSAAKIGVAGSLFSELAAQSTIKIKGRPNVSKRGFSLPITH